MKILVDTCIWSYAFRYKKPDPEIVTELSSIIQDGRVAIIGPIRQEILSGISVVNQFEIIKERLTAFEDIQLNSMHFIKAAEFCNECLRNGVQGSGTDFLICAVSIMENLEIYTNDMDFTHYSKYIPIVLYDYTM